MWAPPFHHLAAGSLLRHAARALSASPTTGGAAAAWRTGESWAACPVAGDDPSTGGSSPPCSHRGRSCRSGQTASTIAAMSSGASVVSYLREAAAGHPVALAAATNSGICSILPGILPTNRSYSSLPAAAEGHHHPAAVADRGGGSALLTGPPAFVFDIDGVLIRGKAVLPEAKQAMAKVSRRREWERGRWGEHGGLWRGRAVPREGTSP